MKRCDVCLKETGELVQLMKSYQTLDIKECCEDCRKVLDEHKSKLQTVTAHILTDWLVAFIKNLRMKAGESK